MKLENNLKVTVIGAGYVGLTTALTLAYFGNRVSCVDKNGSIIDKLKGGRPPFYEPGLDELLQAVGAGVNFTAQLSQADSADVYIIAVGTPSREDGNADLSYVEEAASQIGALLPEGSSPVVVTKSTVPVGTAQHLETVIDKALGERAPRCHFLVASNPEFLREGAALQDSFYPDRIVIGAGDERAFDILKRLYAPILEQSFVPPEGLPRPQGYSRPALVAVSAPSAELIKYASNAFLAVKISFINEFAGLAEKVGADIKDVAEGIGLDKRIGPHFLAAGAGWGGSCLPKDTRAVIFAGSQHGCRMPMVEAAVEVNSRQRLRIVEKLQEVLETLRGCTIGILGLSFKPDTDDLRDSPALEIIDRLLERGAAVRAYDPVAADNCRRSYPGLQVHYASSPLDLAGGCDALVLVTDWKQFASLPWEQLGSRMRQKVMVDGRNMLRRDDMERLGFTYIGMGR